MLHSCAATCKCFFHTAASSRSRDQGLHLVEAYILVFESQPKLKPGPATWAKIAKSPERSRLYSHDLTDPKVRNLENQPTLWISTSSRTGMGFFQLGHCLTLTPNECVSGSKYLLFKFDCSIVKLKPTNGSKDNVSHAEF
jgi:hypothetical protein